MRSFLSIALFSALVTLVHSFGTVVNPNGPVPHTTEAGQAGYNDCDGRPDSKHANCQTLHINSLQDFCLFAPPSKQTVGDSEQIEVAWCTARGHGSRLIPKHALTGVSFIQTSRYIQITGTLSNAAAFLNIPKGDEGGELDPHGADGRGNPIGAIVIATVKGVKVQITEWTQFISDTEFCIRACVPGPQAARYCEHIYDVMGCFWNEPGSYLPGRFESCKADVVKQPMGVYKLKDGSTSTWYQGISPTPAAQAPAKSSQCVEVKSIGGAKY